MSSVPRLYPAQINGQAVSSRELTPIAFAGFAHFTAMQVRNRKVKGMDLHLTRLREASVEFFGRALPDEQVRSYIEMAINEGPVDQSLTATVFSRGGEFTADSMDADPEVLVRTAAPSNGPDGPLRLDAIHYERPLARIKHVGESAKTYYLHQAIRRSFDDAAFVDRQGRLSEATIWNLVFQDGETVVWPRADILKGTMMGIVQRQLERAGIPQTHESVSLARLATLSGAAVMNSWTPGIAVTAIGLQEIPESKSFIHLLHESLASEPARHL